MNIDAVVAAMHEAFWQAFRESEDPFSYFDDTGRIDGELPVGVFGKMAEAAIEALGLGTQWGVVTDDGCDCGEELPDGIHDTRKEAEREAAEKCKSCDSCRNSLPKHVVSRLVSPWVRSEWQTS